MSATAEALNRGRAELHQRCGALQRLAKQLGQPLAPWQVVTQSIDAVEVRVVVVGEVNRGKSTFLNALMGRKIFPPRATVCTAVLTELRDGPTTAEALHRDGRRVPLVLPSGDEISTALQAVVSAKNPDANRLERVRLTFPNRFARDGVVLVDTPGVNDPELWREEITRAAVRQADAAIFLIDPQTPLRLTERIFLQETVHHRVEDRLLFVVTKVDQVSASDLADAMERLHTELGAVVRRPRILAVSSKKALEARVAGDEHALRQSGFMACERTLDTFLCDERVALELTARRGAIRELARGMLQELSIRIGAIQSQDRSLRERVAQAQRQLDAEKARLEQERRRRYAATASLKSDLLSRAGSAWADAERSHLLSESATSEVVQAYRLGSSSGRDAVRDRLGRARRDAEREIYSGFQHLVKRVSFESKAELGQLEDALSTIEETLSAGAANSALKIASMAWDASRDAFRAAGQTSRLDHALIGGAVGLLAGVVGLLVGVAGLLAAVVGGVGGDPSPAVRSALRSASEQGRMLFRSDVDKQAQSLVDKENAQVDLTIREGLDAAQRTLAALERSAASDRATLERELAQLMRIQQAARAELELLS
ncbi:MAG: dynamin family protein [Deltaproteobacteria bacterium]|nr:dynamin family protein [Deltaproteobacteria bacterium]